MLLARVENPLPKVRLIGSFCSVLPCAQVNAAMASRRIAGSEGPCPVALVRRLEILQLQEERGRSWSLGSSAQPAGEVVDLEEPASVRRRSRSRTPPRRMVGQAAQQSAIATDHRLVSYISMPGPVVVRPNALARLPPEPDPVDSFIRSALHCYSIFADSLRDAGRRMGVESRLPQSNFLDLLCDDLGVPRWAPSRQSARMREPLVDEV